MSLVAVYSTDAFYPRYFSTSMPLVQEVSPEEKIDVEQDEEDNNLKKTKDSTKDNNKDNNKGDESKRQERTFLTFSDFDTFRGTFPKRKWRPIMTPKVRIKFS